MPWATMSVTVPSVVIGLGVPAALFATPNFSGLRRLLAIVAMFPGALLLGLSLAPFVLGPARRKWLPFVLVGASLWDLGLSFAI